MEETSKQSLSLLRRKVTNLRKKPQPEQRSEEWFKQRQTRVTASEAASCLYKSRQVCEPYTRAFGLTNFKFKDTDGLNPYEKRENYIIKKCSSVHGQSSFKDTPATLWGKRYEEVANRLYCKLKQTNVIEFGLLPHPQFNWLAASPDGITPDGVMLEIKCPKSRKIDEKAPPIHYWVQMQIQLEVCDLDQCDYLECEIEETLDEQEFLAREITDNQDKGLILRITSSDEEKYLYPPVDIHDTQQYMDWRDKLMASDDTLTPVYYIITKYNIIPVQRSKEWFNVVKQDIQGACKIILNLQNNADDFEKYKQSIHLLNSKAFFEKYNKTTCLIDDDDASGNEVSIECMIGSSNE